ncbi:hypothetical protein [Streptomyces sp. NPDC059788]|uniref:hypothetical protein n=1 Tax=Streptomyces sp. NPDC059788 TaxID=3346948 RepID=UPI003669F2D0
MRQRDAILAEARAEHQRILDALPKRWTRKEYALHASRSPMRAWLFMLLDGRDLSARIFHTLRPEADVRPVNTIEDNA